MSLKRLGLLGGTFNPIHNQHLLLGKCALNQLSLDKLLLIPSGISYLKEGTNVLPADIRYAMCALAVKDMEHFEISDIEVRRKGNSYTCDTLRELSAIYKDTCFYYITGADTLFMMDKWKEPEYIFSHCIIAVAARLDESSYTDAKIKEKMMEYKSRYGARTELIDIPVSDLSSSMIRRAVAAGEDIRSFVPGAVADYIYRNGLYR